MEKTSVTTMIVELWKYSKSAFFYYVLIIVIWVASVAGIVGSMSAFIGD
jgi:hypothetical protein